MGGREQAAASRVMGAGAFRAAAAPPSSLACPLSTVAVLAAALPTAVTFFTDPELVSLHYISSHQHYGRCPTRSWHDMDIDEIVPIARSPQQTQDQRKVQDPHQGGQNMADYDTKDNNPPGPDRDHPTAPDDNHQPTNRDSHPRASNDNDHPVPNRNHPSAHPRYGACLRDGGFEGATTGNNSPLGPRMAPARAAAELSDGDGAGHADEAGLQRGALPSQNNGGAGTRGVSWTRDEREVLCAVYVEATLNAEVGTDQRM